MVGYETFCYQICKLSSTSFVSQVLNLAVGISKIWFEAIYFPVSVGMSLMSVWICRMTHHNSIFATFANGTHPQTYHNIHKASLFDLPLYSLHF